MEVYTEKEIQRNKEIDAHNYNLGKYIALAVNAPKKYPDRPFMAAKEEKKVMTGEEMEKMARRYTILNGGKVK